MFETLTRHVGEVRSALAECPRDLSDAERIDLIRALEEVKCTAAAAQATSAVDLDESQRTAQVAAGLRPERLGDRGLERAAKKLAGELDVAAVAARARRAESERHVSIRPAPDTMCWVTAPLPVTQAVRVYAVLLAAATAARAQGDEVHR